MVGSAFVAVLGLVLLINLAAIMVRDIGKALIPADEDQQNNGEVK